MHLQLVKDYAFKNASFNIPISHIITCFRDGSSLFRESTYIYENVRKEFILQDNTPIHGSYLLDTLGVWRCFIPPHYKRTLFYKALLPATEHDSEFYVFYFEFFNNTVHTSKMYFIHHLQMLDAAEIIRNLYAISNFDTVLNVSTPSLKGQPSDLNIVDTLLAVITRQPFRFRDLLTLLLLRFSISTTNEYKLKI